MKGGIEGLKSKVIEKDSVNQKFKKGESKFLL